MTAGPVEKINKVKIINIASTRTGLKIRVSVARMTNVAVIMGCF
jgi:hypothetical protein